MKKYHGEIPPPPWRWEVKIGWYLVFIYAMFSAVSQLIWCKYALNKSVVEPVGAVVCLSPTPIRDDTVTAIDFQCFHRDTLMLVKTGTKTQKQRDTHRDTSTHTHTRYSVPIKLKPLPVGFSAISLGSFLAAHDRLGDAAQRPRWRRRRQHCCSRGSDGAGGRNYGVGDTQCDAEDSATDVGCVWCVGGRWRTGNRVRCVRARSQRETRVVGGEIDGVGGGGGGRGRGGGGGRRGFGSRREVMHWETAVEFWEDI